MQRSYTPNPYQLTPNSIARVATQTFRVLQQTSYAFIPAPKKTMACSPELATNTRNRCFYTQEDLLVAALLLVSPSGFFESCWRVYVFSFCVFPVKFFKDTLFFLHRCNQTWVACLDDLKNQLFEDDLFSSNNQFFDFDNRNQLKTD